MIPELSLYDFLRAGHVKRWHIVETTRTQTLAEHLWLVTVIAMDLHQQLLGAPGSDFMQMALFHDACEIRTGDTPTPGKRLLESIAGSPIFEEADNRLLPPPGIPYPGDKVGVDDRQLAIIKMADVIEAYHFIEECGVGAHAKHVAKLNRAAVEDLTEYNHVTWLLSGRGTDWYTAVNRVLSQFGLPVVVRELRITPP